MTLITDTYQSDSRRVEHPSDPRRRSRNTIQKTTNAGNLLSISIIEIASAQIR
jgi:hypothetical protein